MPDKKWYSNVKLIEVNQLVQLLGYHLVKGQVSAEHQSGVPSSPPRLQTQRQTCSKCNLPSSCRITRNKAQNAHARHDILSHNHGKQGCPYRHESFEPGLAQAYLLIIANTDTAARSVLHITLLWSTWSAHRLTSIRLYIYMRNFTALLKTPPFEGFLNSISCDLISVGHSIQNWLGWHALLYAHPAPPKCHALLPLEQFLFKFTYSMCNKKMKAQWEVGRELSELL